MTLQKTGPLVLLMFTVLCALPAAAVVGVIPSAFAQEEDDDTNTQVAVPLTDQDQGAANLGANLAANVDTEEIIQEAQSATPPEEEEEPPEFAVFCFESGVLTPEGTLLCFDTLDECELGETIVIFGPVISECKGFVTQPPDSGHCEVTREQGEPPGFVCIVPPPPPP